LCHLEFNKNNAPLLTFLTHHHHCHYYSYSSSEQRRCYRSSSYAYQMREPMQARTKSFASFLNFAEGRTFFFGPVCVCVCVSSVGVCVWLYDRERERERESSNAIALQRRHTYTIRSSTAQCQYCLLNLTA